jgi:hypothetical protein
MRYRALITPTTTALSRPNAVLADARPVAPFGAAQSLPAYRNQQRIFLIFYLLFVSGPSYIARLIVAVFVRVAIKRVITRRAPTNTGEKLFERAKKKFDSTTAIARVLRFIRILATLSSILVGRVFRRALIAARLAMRRVFPPSFVPQAPTRQRRLSSLTRESSGRYYSEVAARTATDPVSVLPLIAVRKLKDDQATNAQSKDVVNVRVCEEFRDRISIELGHFDLRVRLICQGLRELFAQLRGPFLFYQTFRHFAGLVATGPSE